MPLALLIDSDADFLSRLAEPLLDMGIQVFVATRAAEAEQVFNGEPLDLVLVSLRLGAVSYTHLTLPTILLV